MSDIKHTQSKLTQYCINLVHAILDLSEVYLWDGRLDDALHLLESDLVEQIEKELPMKEIIQLQVQRAKTMRFWHYCTTSKKGSLIWKTRAF